VRIYEYKVRTHPEQHAATDEAIRTVQFIRNKCLSLWMGTRGTTRNDLRCLCAVLAATYPFAARLNCQARQASADRAWGPSHASMRTARRRNQARKAIPAFSTTTGVWSTNRRGRGWNPTASTLITSSDVIAYEGMPYRWVIGNRYILVACTQRF
jgi:hypothetical protein